MPTFTKIKRKMKPKFNKAVDEISLILASKMKAELFKKSIDTLTDLKIIKKDIGKTKNIVRLGIEEMKDTAKKTLEEFKTEKKNLENKLKLLKVANRSFKVISDFEEEQEAKKLARKYTKGIEEFNTELKKIRKTKEDIIRHETTRLLNDSIMKKEIKKDELKGIEARLLKQKISKRVIDKFR